MKKISILIISTVSYSQETFSSSGMTIGGTPYWNWPMYRPSIGSLNQSLIFAVTGGSTSEKTIKARLSQWGGIKSR